MDTGGMDFGAAIIKGIIFFLLSFVLGRLGCSAPMAAFFESVTEDVLDQYSKQPAAASRQIDAEIAEKRRQLNQQQALVDEQNRQIVESRRLEIERIKVAEHSKQDEESQHLQSVPNQLVKQISKATPAPTAASEIQVSEYDPVSSTSVRTEASMSNSPVRCKDCDGYGYFKCARCKGKGLILCGDCRGKGYYLYHGRLRLCHFCGGDGVLFSSCPDCHGSGRFACSRCHR